MDAAKQLNPYSVLGLREDASSMDITKAYRKLARKFHPDVSKDPEAKDRMQEINWAYDSKGRRSVFRQVLLSHVRTEA